jgi:membrane fusion protein, multidrug efflux system
LKKTNRIIKRSAISSVLLLGLISTTSAAETATARGVIAALTEATVAVDYAARIKKIPKLEGQAFKAGDVLIVFDCRKNAAEVAASRAATRAKELVAVNNRKLLARGAIGANDVKIADAELEQARAEVQAVQARTGSCDFKAPFDGRLVERIAAEYESPAPNNPLIRIVDTTRLEVETIVPSKWLTWMKPGTEFSFTIDETGEDFVVSLVRMGATVDPVSQTIKAYGVLKDKNESVLPGMSGTATFQLAGS